MAGYRRNKVFLLEFEDEEFAGLEIRARGASVSGLLGLLDLVDVFGQRDKGFTADEMRQIEQLFRALAGCPAGCGQEHRELIDVGLTHYECRILSWNLEDDAGRPVEPGYASLISQDLDFAIAVAMAWFEGVIGTPAPLGGGSSDGGPSPEDLIPMETLSPALLS